MGNALSLPFCSGTALRHCLSVIVAKFASIKNTELSNHSYNIVRPLDPAETKAVTP